MIFIFLILGFIYNWFLHNHTKTNMTTSSPSVATGIRNLQSTGGSVLISPSSLAHFSTVRSEIESAVRKYQQSCVDPRVRVDSRTTLVFSWKKVLGVSLPVLSLGVEVIISPQP
jgi:hypothetical protein